MPKWRGGFDGREVRFSYPSPDSVGDIATIEEECGAFTLWSNGELPWDVLKAGVELALRCGQEVDAQEALDA